MIFAAGLVKFFLRLRDGRPQIFPAAEQRVIKPLQFQPLFRRETRAPQADDVQAANSVAARATVNGGRSWLMAEPPCIIASVPTRQN